MIIGYMRPFFEDPACEIQAFVLASYETDDVRKNMVLRNGVSPSIKFWSI